MMAEEIQRGILKLEEQSQQIQHQKHDFRRKLSDLEQQAQEVQQGTATLRQEVEELDGDISRLGTAIVNENRTIRIRKNSVKESKDRIKATRNHDWKDLVETTQARTKALKFFDQQLNNLLVSMGQQPPKKTQRPDQTDDVGSSRDSVDMETKIVVDKQNTEDLSRILTKMQQVEDECNELEKQRDSLKESLSKLPESMLSEIEAELQLEMSACVAKCAAPE